MRLTDACYLRPDGTFGRADILVRDGVIAEIAEIAAAGSRPSDLDCSGYVVLPGLVNGHYHSQATLMRGLEAGLELFDWFGDSPGGRAQSAVGAWLDDAANLTDIETVVRHEYVTLLRQGVTTVADCGVSEAVPPTLLADLGDQVGMRVIAQAYDDWIERVEDPDRYTVNIESEESLTREYVERAVGWRDRYRPRFAGHCLETVPRRERVLADWGRSTIAVLDEHGLLGPRTVLFHGCEMDADDVAAIARTGAVVMHCPVSNLGLHGRIPPAVEWRRAGITVGLGTDWGDTDMWGVLRAAWLLQQRVPDQPESRTAEEVGARILSTDRATHADVLRMATRGGAVGYGRDDLGEIAAGRTADLVLLDAARLRPYVHRADVSTLASAILACAGPGVVRHVLVAGKWALRDGEPTRVAPMPLAAEYDRIAASLLPA